jgi:hypothetical protein
MTKEQSNIADVEFIMRAVDRFYQMSIHDVIARITEHREDAFATLSLTKGGHLFCGREAYDRFEALADRTVKSGSEDSKAFDRASYLRALRTSFVDVFIEGTADVTQSSVTKFLNRAKQVATKNLEELTHHLPCVIFYDTDPAVFAVGPVTFRARETFLSEFNDPLTDFAGSERAAFVAGLAKSKPDLSEDARARQADAFATTVDAKVRDFYAQYGWVASVAVGKAHWTVSKRRAEQTIDAALDVLRLFVPSMPERFGRANSPRAPYEIHELAEDKHGRLVLAMQ